MVDVSGWLAPVLPEALGHDVSVIIGTDYISPTTHSRSSLFLFFLIWLYVDHVGHRSPVAGCQKKTDFM